MIIKPLDEYKFTTNQLKSIYSFLNELFQKKNNGIKIDGVRYFTNKQNNFFCSLCEIDENHQTKLRYIEIDKEGQIIELQDLYTSLEDLVNKFSKFSEIQIM